jgi:hypothetical protein
LMAKRLMACAGEAQETTTLRAGSSPQVSFGAGYTQPSPTTWPGPDVQRSSVRRSTTSDPRHAIGRFCKVSGRLSVRV